MTATLELDWVHDAPPLGRSLVVVAPHPDDEVIGASGVMRWAAAHDVPITIVAVTDGEGSHARSTRIRPDQLRVRRAQERGAALEVLGLRPRIERLGIPDGHVRRHERNLTAALTVLAGPNATLVAPWRHDRHPDHEAVGRAAAVAARRSGAHLWGFPIWAKVDGTVGADAADHQSQLDLGDGLRATKAEAVRCYASQLVPVGPDPLDGPVVHPHELAAMLDGHEAVLWS